MEGNSEVGQLSWGQGAGGEEVPREGKLPGGGRAVPLESVLQHQPAHMWVMSARLTKALLKTEQFADPESFEAPPASPAWRNVMNTPLNRDAREGRPQKRGDTLPLKAAPDPPRWAQKQTPKGSASSTGA